VEQNIKRHRILQEKTLAFLEENIIGHGFISGRDGTKIDRTDLRLNIRVKHRIDDLDELRACLEYANEAPTRPLTAHAQNRTEIVTLKPGIWGMSFDVKEALRRLRAWFKRRPRLNLVPPHIPHLAADFGRGSMKARLPQPCEEKAEAYLRVFMATI
jgi:hypothetical protein